MRLVTLPAGAREVNMKTYRQNGTAQGSPTGGPSSAPGKRSLVEVAQQGSQAAPAAQAKPAAAAAKPDQKGKDLDDTSYLHGYTHVNGTALDSDAATDPKTEAPVLNAIRDNQKKFDPDYLLKLQDHLGVSNRSGAFNTETLRKLREHYPRPGAVTATTILQGDILTALVPGQPFVSTGSGYGGGAHGSTGQVSGNERKADVMARAAGYDSYRAMHAQFTRIELLGLNLGQGLPHLAARVRLADQWLRARHPLDKDNATWKDIAKNKLGWNYSGNAAYGDNVADIGEFGIGNGYARGPHMHSSGLALDIDVKHNPWVFTGGAMNDIMANHLRYAAQLYGGEAITPKQLMKWSDEMSTEELYARVDMVSKSLGRYLALAENGTDAEIEEAFITRARFSAADAKDVVVSVRRFGKKGFKDAITQGKRVWQDNMGRGEATGLTTHSLEIVVALRDVAGLAWGGTEMSEGENGDFMHFDCRNEPIGQTILAFARANRGVSDTERGVA